MSHAYAPLYGPDEQDYSESDCPSDGQVQQQQQQQGLALAPPLPPEFTELYRRKRQTVASGQGRSPAGTYCHAHMQGYYDPQGRLPPTCVCNLAPDPRYYYYKPPPPHPEAAFRTTPQFGPELAPKTGKKYPITARTPRYYRYPTAPLPKRPSTLCLPVTCQPDPATSPCHRPPRKTSADAHQQYRSGGVQEGMTYAINDYVAKSTLKRTSDVRAVDSEGDLNSRLTDLENLLTKFEDDEVEEQDDDAEIVNVNELSKILKPKVPASVKAKQEKVLKLKVVKPENSSNNTNKLDVKDIENQSLDGLIKKLSKESISKRNCDDLGDNQSLKITDEVLNRHQKQSFHLEQKPLDDNSALELHKSKSYIVSLIDKALSKELGTVPGDKCSRKEFLTMNPKKAIDLVNRHTAHSKTVDKSMSLQVASPSIQKRPSDNCECKSEEPLYLKQLKQLRWSHLRHIQREAKRLADLERFLDSFGGEVDNSQ